MYRRDGPGGIWMVRKTGKHNKVRKPRVEPRQKYAATSISNILGSKKEKQKPKPTVNERCTFGRFYAWAWYSIDPEMTTNKSFTLGIINDWLEEHGFPHAEVNSWCNPFVRVNGRSARQCSEGICLFLPFELPEKEE